MRAFCTAQAESVYIPFVTSQSFKARVLAAGRDQQKYLTPPSFQAYIPPRQQTTDDGFGSLECIAAKAATVLPCGYFFASVRPSMGGLGGEAARPAGSDTRSSNLVQSAHPSFGSDWRAVRLNELEYRTMEPTLPKVIQFNHAYDVKLETHDGRTTVIARVKQWKYDTGYKRFHDLPFVYTDTANNRVHWFYVQKSNCWTEQRERANYFWQEYVRYVRGHQKKRRADAISYTRYLIDALGRYPDCKQESDFFIEHIAEALVAHLRVGLDEGKTDAKLKAEEAEEVAA